MLEKLQNITPCRHLEKILFSPKTARDVKYLKIRPPCDILFFVCSGKPNLLDMGSLLIKPVQRIMKYPLLLSELWQATPEDHPDYLPLQEALTATKIINVNINEFRRRKDIGEISHTQSRHSGVGTGVAAGSSLSNSVPSDEV